MRRVPLILLALICSAPAWSASPVGADLDQALREAKARRAAVIVDFHAPWCYSCYYMARNVLNGPEWDAVLRRAVVLEQDADSPQGSALQERWGVKALPSYLVLDANGEELGRILGEQTREEFYGALDKLLDRGGSLAAIAARVTGADTASVAAAREVLQSYHARYDAQGALRWFEQLPAGARGAVAGDAEAALWLARLRFLGAAQRKDTAACLAAGAEVLKGELGCARAYELDRYLGCAQGQPQARTLLEAQRAPALELVESGAFGVQRCADERSVVLTAADLHGALGDSAAETALVQRAAGAVERRIGAQFGADRNLADNLRVYLDRLGHLSGDYTRLDALMPKLIAAWPDDYVYAFRHGRSLLARGQAAAALPFLEQAAPKAYGINRLKVAEQRVMALQALGRDADARRVVGETLKANGPWFPEEAARLKALVKTGA